ncbi:hypothetical protein T4B_4252, partial [Trichinella pseudospiralis]
LQTMDNMTQIKREQSCLNSVKLGKGCFEMMKLFLTSIQLSISNEENKTFEQGRHKAERRWYKVEERKIAGACG